VRKRTLPRPTQFCALAVLDAQVGRYGLPKSVAELGAALIEADVGGVFRLDSDGQLIFGFGKYRGQLLARVARIDPRYLGWMLRQSFLDDPRDLIRVALATVRPCV